jgi:hypothetical protein
MRNRLRFLMGWVHEGVGVDEFSTKAGNSEMLGWS